MEKGLYDSQISEFANLEIERLKAENERLREVLEEIRKEADNCSCYIIGDSSCHCYWFEDKATKALSG